MASWETTENGRRDYVHVRAGQVVVGHDYGSGQTDSAGATSYRDFLEKRIFQSLVRGAFGEDVLDQVIEAVELARRR